MKIQIPEIDKNKITNFSDGLNISSDLARLLINRGISTINEAKKYLYAGYESLTSPFEYSGMKEAVALIKRHIANNGKIVVYGDYDCDGVSAVAILLRAFRKNGVDIDYYIPVRQEEGYGLNSEAILKIKDNLSCDLLITVDCGIRSVNEVALAKASGMDVIVTDHHGAGDVIPDCTVIDPVLNEKTTPLCGAGVAFFLVRAIYGEEFANEFIDICAIATVADIVPLVDDNRIIVKCGIEAIRKGRTKIGIEALVFASGIERKKLNSYDIGFKLAPRLNAAGRLSEANASVTVLTTEDITEARFLAEELSNQNSSRQDLCKAVYDEAIELLKGYNFDKKLIILRNNCWNEGVIGIAASKLTEFFNMPTILFSETPDGRIKGSARSISGIDITALIATQSGKLISYGGHTMAAGLSMAKENFEEFCNGIYSEAEKLGSELFGKIIKCDGYLPIVAADGKLFREIELLEPCGFGNKTPIFCDPDPEIKFSRIGQSEHFKGKTKYADVVCFYKYGQLSAYQNAKEKKIVYSLGKNIFNGNEYNQIKIKNLIFEDYSVASDTLQAKFSMFSNKILKNKQPKNLKKITKNALKLDVFFENNLFEEYLKTHNNVAVIFENNDIFEYANTVVLAPHSSFPFEYYGKITVHGRITDDIKTYFDGLGATYADEERKLSFDGITVEQMRDVYKRLAIIDGNKFSSVEDIYRKACNFDDGITFENFVVYFCILDDVKLIKFVDGGILNVNKSKTDMNSSSIFRYIYG